MLYMIIGFRYMCFRRSNMQHEREEDMDVEKKE